jgi:glycosyltransferase involved in cell wall biosynthesis
MNILVYPHQMILGGSQINAIELAAKIRDRGHRVTVVAPGGDLVSLVQELGLDYLPTRSDTANPSVRTALQLREIIRERSIDLIHAYEWRPAIEAAFGAHLLDRVPMVITVLSMSVSKFLPRHIPLIVGTQELAVTPNAKEVHVMEPPVDVFRNQARDVASARALWGFRDDETVVSIVCRLTSDLQKKHGLLEAIDVVGQLADQQQLRFLVVGGGSGLDEVRERSEAVNAQLGRQVVIVTGSMSDPRKAYEAADIVLGMGSSVLRAMAFAKPVIVQGANGFWRVFDESSQDLFLFQGWYGDGGRGNLDLAAAIEVLAADPQRRVALGCHGRTLVEDRFNLDKTADQLVGLYERALTRRSSLNEWLPSITRSMAGYAKCTAVTALKAARHNPNARST